MIESIALWFLVAVFLYEKFLYRIKFEWKRTFWKSRINGIEMWFYEANGISATQVFEIPFFKEDRDKEFRETHPKKEVVKSK